MINEVIINIGPQHPPTHGASRPTVISYGEIMQRIRSEIGSSHRGPEKSIDRSHISSAIGHPDRSDHVPTTIQESSYIGAIEIFIQSYISLSSSSFRILHVELHRSPNHVSATTTHATDIGSSTSSSWGFEEREKLINHIEPISGPRSHNASSATNNYNNSISEILGY